MLIALGIVAQLPEFEGFEDLLKLVTWGKNDVGLLDAALAYYFGNSCHRLAEEKNFSNTS